MITRSLTCVSAHGRFSYLTQSDSSSARRIKWKLLGLAEKHLQDQHVKSSCPEEPNPVRTGLFTDGLYKPTVAGDVAPSF